MSKGQQNSGDWRSQKHFLYDKPHVENATHDFLYFYFSNINVTFVKKFF